MNSETPKRQHIRALPDNQDIAKIDLTTEDEPFDCQYVGLIIDEAPMGGCSLVVSSRVPLSVGQKCRVEVGKMAPLQAEVKWEKEIDPGLVRYGFQFLE